MTVLLVVHPTAAEAKMSLIDLDLRVRGNLYASFVPLARRSDSFALEVGVGIIVEKIRYSVTRQC